MSRTKMAGIAVLMFVAAATSQAASQPVPAVSSITGYSDGFTVTHGRFVGQIVAVPPGGTNRYKNFLASDSYPNGTLTANPYFWDINGSNFGSTPGTLDFGVNPSPFTSVTVVSWTNTKIRVKVVAGYSFLSTPIALKVTSPTGQTSTPFKDNVCGTIKGRGAGQCTWYVASVRLQHGLSIPPTPWGSNGRIPGVGALDSGFRPQLWDCMNYAGHIAIITSTPVLTSNADGSVKWTFTVSEYNALWNESLSTSTRTYGLSKPNSLGQRRVATGIGTNLNLHSTAFGYYR